MDSFFSAFWRGEGVFVFLRLDITGRVRYAPGWVSHVAAENLALIHVALCVFHAVFCPIFVFPRFPFAMSPERTIRTIMCEEKHEAILR